MVPILVVLGVMFVGICVAMQLFSKAQFRNQRSVLNSPNTRLMNNNGNRSKKGSKKRKNFKVPQSRKTSLSTQPSPLSSRSETQQGSQDPLNPSNKSTASSLVGTPISQPKSSCGNSIKKVCRTSILH
ncbi:uncharacterized protein LOC143227009 [Tachypleus tridentatus]|uniref:uncharacterized protein LOC143227009 n=1 Tax=Tachypleus tridentatus TaxID=6853 RepID=UPI003FD16589